MPITHPALCKQVQEARVASFGGKASIDYPASFPKVIKTINFDDGEIDSILLTDGRLLKRGAVVKVSSRYSGTEVAVVTSFLFGKTQLPIVVSMGGAQGELIYCVHPDEVELFPKQSEIRKAVRLRAELL